MISKETSEEKNTKALRDIDLYAKWLDSRFTIPGTKFKFGFDFLIGLIPGVGDLITYILSSLLVISMARHGASGLVLARMVLNVAVDAFFGSIPIIGDLFDLGYKANNRNVRLLREHYNEGKYKGSAWRVIIPVFLIFILLLVGLVYLIFWLLSSLF